MHDHLRLDRRAGQRVALQLIAVSWLGQRAAVAVPARDADPQQHLVQRLTRLGRTTTAVLEVAGGARTSVEQRAQAVARLDRGRRAHPALVEERVADEERRTV